MLTAGLSVTPAYAAAPDTVGDSNNAVFSALMGELLPVEGTTVDIVATETDAETSEDECGCQYGCNCQPNWDVRCRCLPRGRRSSHTTTTRSGGAVPTRPEATGLIAAPGSRPRYRSS